MNTNSYMPIIANNLKVYRELSNLQQNQVALALGIERSTYTYYETGKSSLSLLNAISLASMFGIDLNTLAGIESSSSGEFRSNDFVNSSESVLSMNRLTKREQNMMLIFRRLSNSSQDEITDKANELLEKELETEE